MKYLQQLHSIYKMNVILYIIIYSTHNNFLYYYVQIYNIIMISNTISLPLEIREHILRFTGDNFPIVVEGILGGQDIYINYKEILERLITLEEYEGDEIRKLPCGRLHSSKYPALVQEDFVFDSEDGEYNEDDMSIQKSWYFLGKPHRDNGKPTAEYYREDGQLKEKRWIVESNGERKMFVKYYRKNVENDVYEEGDHGQLKRERFYVDGVLHREDGPALLQYRKNGRIKEESWLFEEEYHREDGPALIFYHKNGQIKQEIWYIHNMAGRKDNPAAISYFKTGKIKQEIWYENNVVHKIHGSAIIQYYKTGRIRTERNYFNGLPQDRECVGYGLIYRKNGQVKYCLEDMDMAMYM